MIFEVDSETKTLNAYKSFWNPRELELERYLISTAEEEEVPTLNSSVFGETLLLVSNQVRTRTSKRADILALDRMGNSVIIELKRKDSPLGVETQALQYLADFSKFKGRTFIKRFSGDSPGLEENIYGFLGDEVKTSTRIAGLYCWQGLLTPHFFQWVNGSAAEASPSDASNTHQ